MRRAILFFLLATCGCGFWDRVFGPDDQLTVLLRNQDRWRSLALQDYDYDFERICECLDEQTQPVRISVRNGEVTNVVGTYTKQQSPKGWWPTIELLFATVEEEVRRGYPVKITYNGEFHFPGNTDSEGGSGIDDEFVMTAHSLSPIPK